MLIKYINTKEDYCDVLEYFGIKKLKVLNFIAFCLSIVAVSYTHLDVYKRQFLQLEELHLIVELFFDSFLLEFDFVLKYIAINIQITKQKYLELLEN